MVNYFRAFRRFERFLFRGVPEHPEPNWEREINANIVDRHTGKSHLIKHQNSHQRRQAEVIATITFKPQERQIEVVHKCDKPKNLVH